MLVHELHPAGDVRDEQAEGEVLEDGLVVAQEAGELGLRGRGGRLGGGLRVGEAHEIHLVDVLCRAGEDELALAHDADPVREAVHVVDPVRDEEDPHPFLGAPQEHRHDAREGGRGELLQRLVEDQEGRARVQLLEDVHDRPVGETEAAKARAGRDVEAVAVEELGGRLVHPAGRVPGEVVHPRVVGKQRLGHREVVVQAEVLVDHADAQPVPDPQRERRVAPAADDDRSRPRPQHSAHHHGESGLAGAVLAHQRVDLRMVDREGDPPHDLQAAVVVRHPLESEKLLSRVDRRTLRFHSARSCCTGSCGSWRAFRPWLSCCGRSAAAP